MLIYAYCLFLHAKPDYRTRIHIILGYGLAIIGCLPLSIQYLNSMRISALLIYQHGSIKSLNLDMNFSLIALCLVGFIQAPVWPKFDPNRLKIPRLWGNSPLLTNPPGFASISAILAAIVLVSKLGWHGGAYMIYYNHLLLPPLIIAAISKIPRIRNFSRLCLYALPINALLILVLCPSLPKTTQFKDGLLETLKQHSVLVDPLLEPLTRAMPQAHLCDNGQSEYILNITDAPSTPTASKKACSEWLEVHTNKLNQQQYDYLLLSTHYNRPHLLYNLQASPALSKITVSSELST